MYRTAQRQRELQQQLQIAPPDNILPQKSLINVFDESDSPLSTIAKLQELADQLLE